GPPRIAEVWQHQRSRFGPNGQPPESSQLASQFLALAEKQRATVPLMIGHRMMGSVLHTGAFAEGRARLDRAIALSDPAEHRPLATRFGQDIRAAALATGRGALCITA